MSGDEVTSGGGLVGRHVPFLDLLRVRPVSAERGTARFELTIGDRHLRTLGLLHGGVTATLLDTAMGMAAGTLAPDGFYVVTVQLNVNYIRPAFEGETVTATGEVQHGGRQTTVTRGEIRTADGALVATGSATFMFIPRPDDTPSPSRG